MGVNLGVAANLNVKVVASFRTDEFDQLAGVFELPKSAMAAGQIAAQGYHALDTARLEASQLCAHAVTRRANARKVRRSGKPISQNGLHGLQGAVLGGAARTVSHAEKLRLERIQFLAHHRQLVHAFGRFGREKFNADRQRVRWQISREFLVHGFGSRRA